MNGFAVEADEVKRKTKQKDQIPPSSGPSSSNPGRWLTEVYAEVREGEPAGEAYRTVISILEAYRPGLRYRNRRMPVRGQGWESDGPASEFIVLDPDLETKAFCYSNADVSAMREVDAAPSFTMLGQSGVLSGVDLQLYRQGKRRDDELYDRKPKAKKTKRAKKETTPKHHIRRVPMATLAHLYEAWFDAPTEENQTAFWREAYEAFLARVAFDHSGDGFKLRDSERAEELVMDFLLVLFKGLTRKREAGEKIADLERYLNGAWARERTDALVSLANWNRRNGRNAVSRDDGEAEQTISLDDRRDEAMDSMYMRSHDSIPPSNKEVLNARMSKLSLIDPTMRDYVAFKLTGMRDKEVGEHLNLSRQAVGRLKVKAVRALANVSEGMVA